MLILTDEGRTLVKVKKELKWVEFHLRRSVEGHEGRSKEGLGTNGGGGGGAADRQADSSAVTDDRAKQRLARDSRPALSNHSEKKQTKHADFWLLVCSLAGLRGLRGLQWGHGVSTTVGHTQRVKNEWRCNSRKPNSSESCLHTYRPRRAVTHQQC